MPADPAEALADLICLDKEGEPPESRRGRLSDRVIKGAAYLVDNSRCLEYVNAWRDEDDPTRAAKGGRPSLIEERVVLILLIALVSAGEAPLITNLAEAYRSRLSSPARDLLGLPRVEKASEPALYARIYRAIHRILEPIDPYPAQRGKRPTRSQLEELRKSWQSAETNIDGIPVKVVDQRLKRLRTLTNLLLESSSLLLPENVQSAWLGNICIDATLVRAGGQAGAPTGKKSPKSSDLMSVEHQAGWYVRQDDAGKVVKSAWGYEAHLAVATANDPATIPDFPLLVMGMSLDTPSMRVGENAVIAAHSIVERGHPAGLCAADRAYFPNSAAEKYQLPMRGLGYSLIGDYRSDQLGVQAQRDGALLIEGSWYCPSIPNSLRNATKDFRDNKITQAVYEKRISQRGQYLFRPKHRPDSTGNVSYMCPARGPGATASCPLVSQPGPVAVSISTTRTTILNPPQAPDKACTNKSSIMLPLAPDPTNKSGDDLRAKYFQDIRYGTPKWQAHYSTQRNTVEGVNAYNKDPNWSDLEEAGRRRIRGFAGQAFLTACLLLASNIRKIHSFMTKASDPGDPDHELTYQPRRHKTTPDVTRFRPDATGPPQLQSA